MRVLFADTWSAFPLALAGGHRVNHCLLRCLAERPGIDCLALIPKLAQGTPSPDYYPKLSDFAGLGVRSFELDRPRGGDIKGDIDGDRWLFDCGYPVWAVDDVARQLSSVLRDFAPDVVFAQNPRPPVSVLAEAVRRGLPAVCYLHDARFDPETLARALAAGAQALCCSEFMRRLLAERCGVEATVLHPILPAAEYEVEPAPDGSITLINPVAQKGFEVFLELVPRLPRERFLVVESWPLGAELAAVERRLAPLPNVRFQRRVADMREVYRQTRLLLMPSKYEEPAGRVVVEAQVSGIPVVASARGGLPEMVGAGGLLVADYLDPDAWARAVGSVLADYERFSAAARANARRDEFSPGAIVDRFLEACARSIGGDKSEVARALPLAG
jgi:glycosyltransferase involved in cell wall biosynthesis